MYINKNFDTAGIISSYLNTDHSAQNGSAQGTFGSAAYIRTGQKTWPEVIRLYKETKKKKTLKS